MMRLREQSGFTLLEALIVMGISVLLLSIATINLGGASQKASVSSVSSTLASDMHGQRLQAMTGSQGGSDFGIYFTQSNYTLFRGSAYDPDSSDNFTFDVDPQVQLTNILFPNSQVVFASGTGEVIGFLEGSDSVSVTGISTGDQKTMTVNSLGTIISFN